MKKFLAIAAFLFVFGAFTNAQAAQELPLVGEYVNDAGWIAIAPAAKAQGPNVNYNVGIQDKTGKCHLNIVAGTWKENEQQSPVGKTLHPKAIVAVESQTYPNFSLWPEDQTIKLADDALPFDKLDPACAVFKGNMVFTRK